MEALSKDVLFNIATMLDLDDLLNFCSSSDRINRLVCQQDAIWNFKLMKEFPNYKEYINQRGREAYELLIDLVKVKKELKYKDSIYKLYNASTLYLNEKGINTIPPEIGKLINLQTIYLNKNNITTIPPEIGNLKRLERLDLSKNKITSIPPEIGKLSQLQELLLYNNQITSLPLEMSNLTNLKKLDVTKNKITSLPPEIATLMQFRELEIDKQ